MLNPNTLRVIHSVHADTGVAFLRQNSKNAQQSFFRERGEAVNLLEAETVSPGSRPAPLSARRPYMMLTQSGGAFGAAETAFLEAEAVYPAPLSAHRPYMMLTPVEGAFGAAAETALSTQLSIQLRGAHRSSDLIRGGALSDHQLHYPEPDRPQREWNAVNHISCIEF
ncbi:hypothetical protein R3P38DRAFT_2798734 [Favolaschia claudopus]|uniref:Uncharacterized protein n=1 Tax=Favolaschia claudopus TaxID=2862362 RepID=A0AAW0A2I2_9AGAR